MKKLKKRLNRLQRRQVTLLEVLIAFAIVALCVLPLIYPQTFIFFETRRYIDEIHLDRQVGALYADVLDRLYKQTVPWQDIENETLLEVDEAMLNRTNIPSNFPWKGRYYFWHHIDKKDSKEDKEHVYKKSVIFLFLPKGSKEELKKDSKGTRRYNYPIVIWRKEASDKA